jgi:ABC-2 type transport system ATP-binding protein
MSTPIFSFTSISKTYRNKPALKSLTMQGEPGRIIALLGENGAGKSTAISLLMGLIPPTSGSSQVLGFSSQTQGRDIRRTVGYMSDKPPLYDWMTVDQIGWFTSGFYAPGFRERYNTWMQKHRVDPTQKIKHLSKGMRSKVALGLTMSHEPPLLVLDEPTSGLDPLVRREFLESMVDYVSTGRTVLLSSHQVGEVERVADDVAIIQSGELKLFAPLETIKRTTHELLITHHDVQLTPPTLPKDMTLIHHQRQDRTWKLLIQTNHELDTPLHHHPHWQHQENILHTTSHTPSLEDITICFMQNQPPLSQPAEVEVPS